MTKKQRKINKQRNAHAHANAKSKSKGNRGAGGQASEPKSSHSGPKLDATEEAFRNLDVEEAHNTAVVETTAVPLSKSGMPNNLTSTFAKDSDAAVEARKQAASTPLDLSRRSEPLVSAVFPSLNFPRRPPWTSSTTKEELERNEQRHFDAWLRQIHGQYDLEELSPFEHNLNVWRQLWRVLERSDLVLMVADVRNPLLYIPLTFYRYVTEECGKPLVVALTKCDLVSAAFLERWLAYLKRELPRARFVPSYGKAKHTDGQGGVRARRKIITGKATKKEIEELLVIADAVLFQCLDAFAASGRPLGIAGRSYRAEDEGSADAAVGEREHHVPTIGFVGCPNTGKSSLLNQIMGKHVVSVSRTVGHTKHFQTHFVRRAASSDIGKRFGNAGSGESSEPVVVAKLCDSPGLVFPSAWRDVGSALRVSPRCLFELSGLYRIAQIREPFTAVRFLAEHVPIERLYNVKLDEDDYGDQWTPYAVCGAIADMRGYTMARGGGAPDVHRAGLEIITDVVDGVVLLAFEPPADRSLDEALASAGASAGSTGPLDREDEGHDGDDDGTISLTSATEEEEHSESDEEDA